MSLTDHLWRAVAISDHYPPDTCWAWVESAGRACGKPETVALHLCARHTGVAHRKLVRETETEAAARRRIEDRDRARLVPRLPQLRARLARVDAEIDRRDPAPPTTDPAAFGGVGSTVATAYRTRVRSDANVARLAELHAERIRLARDVAYAERLAGESA